MTYLECAVCGNKWKAIRDEEPERCPSKTCRSKKWRDGKDGRAANKFRFTVIVTEDQFGQFERAAKRQGKEVGEWLRELGAVSISAPLLLDMGPMTPEKYEESITAPHQVAVLEHAARAEAPIGRSVAEFLMTNAAKIAVPSSLESPEGVETDLPKGKNVLSIRNISRRPRRRAQN